MALTTVAAEVYRDYALDGVPSSGVHDPKKTDIRRLLGGYEQVINAFTSSGGIIGQTLAGLNTNLNYPSLTMAWVLNDPIAGNNGIYQKQGASGSGSWLRAKDLPYSFIVASDVGAGTANAIEATSDLPISSSALVLLNIFETNGPGPVTVRFNGEGPVYSIKTASGNDPAAGGLPAGMQVMGRVSGATFRLYSDQASAAIVAQAEGEAERAEAAAERAEAAIAPANPMMYGAVGDNVADDTAALTAMFQATGTREFDGLGKTYRISNTVLVERGDVVVKNLFTSGLIADTTPSIKFLGSQGAAVSLTIAAPAKSNEITVANTSSFSVDQWVWIRSDTTLWGSIPFGELAKIRAINTGTGVVTLYDRIFLYYNISDAARVVPLTMRENITIDNCGVVGDVSVTNQIGFEFEFCSNVKMRNPRTWDCEYVHIWFKATSDARVFGGVGERTGTLQGLNYGIVAGNSCNNILVDGYTGRSMRHVVSTGGSFGINRNIRAVNSTALDSLDAGFDAHPQTAECDYSNNTVHMRNGVASGADGIICQGADLTANGNKVYGPTRHGVFYQPNLAFAGVKNSCKIADNHCESIQGSGTTAGVDVLAGVSGADIASVNISDNTTVGFVNGCFVGATGANITDVTIGGHGAEGNSGRGVQIQASAGRTIVRGSISGCVVSQLPGAFEAINLTSTDAGGILNFAISGNSTQGGTYGVRGVGTDRIATVGNVVTGATTPISVAGAASVVASNIT